MNFNTSYNRAEFISFLRNEFLPDDFLQEETAVDFAAKPTYSQRAIKLGVCKSLDLVVYEVTHVGKEDPRVGLSKEAFRMLSEEWQDRALVLFVPANSASNYRFSLIEIKLEGDSQSAKVHRKYSNPRRYSYLLGEGIGGYTPNKYLAKGRVKDEKDLHDRFSVEVLTKAFYNELSDWNAWAIGSVVFPGEQLMDTEDKRIEHRSKNVIRLLTRLLFVWFLKQKNLIPWQLFDEEYLNANILNDFKPNLQIGLFKEKSKESKYYKAILQNLFFATLNCPITPQSKEDSRERGFRKSDWYGQGFGEDHLMRYKDNFSNPQHFLDLVNERVPFLNGGLFDCLDDKENKIYIDGFSDNLIKPNILKVPDFLFFGETQGKGQDLSDFYGDKKKKSSDVLGLIDILKKYNFTIEENMPFDQEVSLDPELLGKVFENLLASYNPETKTTARKQTGSFYTPREIVQYMVDESLVAHLKRTVGEELEEEYRKLMRYTDEKFSLSADQHRAIIQSLQNCKVLDPACGSGAFPVGVLQQMVHILSQLDPKNELWKNLILEEAVRELSSTLKDCTSEEREEVQADINRSFDDSVNRPDYARKLYLIENCIFGVDIQSIAVQISKLRFFISLVVDQKPNDDAADNFGIRPLPNLEAKFAAANTLVGLNKRTKELFDNREVERLQEKMIQTSHRIFGAKSNKTKNKYKARVEELQGQIADKLEELGTVGNDDARLMRQWRMFDQNASSPFFDPWWMFGVQNGFDIVIGNPPYGVSIKDELRKNVENFLGKVPDYEIYYYFIQIGEKILSDRGILSYIIPNTYLFNTFADKYRTSILSKWNIIEILDCSKFPIFESATVLNTINTWQKKSSECVGYRNTSNANNFQELISQERLKMKKSDLLSMNQNWGLAFRLDRTTINLITKIKSNRNQLCRYFPDISQGLIAYDKYQGQTEDIISQRAYHHKAYKDGLKKWLWGGDVSRYNVLWNNEEYIDYCDEIANPRHPKFFIGRRILVREITNPSIYAAFTDEEFYNDPSVIIILDNGKYSLFAALGILNSKLATFFHFNHAPKATKGAFPKILVKDIKEFPLPNIADGDKIKIETLVQSILSLKKENINADTVALETEIDQLVYALYGLSEEEIKIIEQK